MERSTESPEHNDGPAADYRLLLESASDFCARVSPSAHFLEVSPRCEKVTGWSPGELRGRDMRELVHHGDMKKRDLAEAEAMDAEQAASSVLRMLCKDGTYIWVESTAQPLRGESDGIVGFEVVFRDVTARVEAEEKLVRHAHQHETLAHLGQVALGDGDLSKLLQEVVAAVTSTLEVELSGVLKLRDDEESLDVLAHSGEWRGALTNLSFQATQAGYALITQAPVISEDLRSEKRFKASSLIAAGMLSGVDALIGGTPGRPFGVLSAHSSKPRQFNADDVNFLVAVANVISAAVERDAREQATRHASLHDPLTGLPNRTLAQDRIVHALARRRRDSTNIATMMIDLDRFKVVNDSLGHDVGDELLIAVAQRLQEAVRPSDTVARLGGDEFLVLCERARDVRQVLALAERLAAAVSRPLMLAGREHFLTVSIGISIAEGADSTAASLLRDADAAMYRAKRRGPGLVELFNEAMRAQLLARLRTETELRHAVEHGDLILHYQPVLDVATGRPIATEALVRWEHPHNGLIPPLDFIPIAEETELILELGRHVLEKACEQGASWQERFGIPLQMFVNVSARQLAKPKFASEVAEVARSSGLQPGTLAIEVTESVLIDETNSSVDVVQNLHAHGLRLLLDDFGTGYSSLGYLRRLPLDGVKVDRSFIDGLGNGPEEVAIMRAIVEMCGVLGLEVIAEGVETEAQLSQLRRLGCGSVQGYLLCRPMPATDVTLFLQRRLVGELVT
jgi:diguanylate cyclase (GGDEF)-like protein/PAS domain S-box-containing protein